MKKLLKSFLSSKMSLKKKVASLIASGLFDETWYRKTYSDVRASDLTAIEHYLTIGEDLGHQPNPYFDTKKYLKSYAAARRSALPAILHYASIGWKNHKNPSRDFNNDIYLAQYPDIAAKNISPLQDYIQTGQHEGRLVFHCRLKAMKNGDQLTDDMIMIAASGLFDGDWYRLYYTDMRARGIDPLFHFVTEGDAQDRKANPIFDPAWYRQRYRKDVGDENPLVYFIREGEKKLHNPAPHFGTKEYYKLHKKSISRSEDSALGHFLMHGIPFGKKIPEPVLPTSKTVARKKDAKKSIVTSAKLPLSNELRGMIEHTPQPLTPKSWDFNSKCLNIHWVIPDFAAGGGGHMTIFRMVSYFERLGHKQTIWINNPTMHKSANDAADSILKHFQQFTGTVRIVDRHFEKAKGDIVFATDCWTVWPVLSLTGFKRRFYFVQDFEPSFHPMGSNYLAAEQTYREDLDCICASPWLAQLMTEKYGRWARPFWLAADTDMYHPASNPPANKVLRIAFYARHFTARRAVELGMLALEELANRKVEFEVDFFGAPIEFESAPFKFTDHGVASPEDLATLFQNADIGVVFSATNYSLVPQEMMACGLPIVEMRGESTECIFPEETVALAEPHPIKIADALESLIKDRAARDAQAKAALTWVAGFSWQASAELIQDAILERLAEFGTDIPVVPRQQIMTKPKASVVIPTLDAGPILDRVLKAVTEQETPWPYEILVIDSGSTDGTLETIAKYPEVKLHQIEKKNFNHGGTRNLGVELTEGEFIAFLTHDALPANERWLKNLVSAIEQHPNAAGAFGKHLPYPEASEFTKRDLNGHFDQMATQPLYVDKETDKKLYAKGEDRWRQFLHFYSDNNSCMRRSVWEKIPYREIKFGEDQVWADDVIAAGYGKVYAVRSVVYHSHDFSPTENRERNMTEAAFFKHFFGYKLIGNEQELGRTLKDLNAHDEAWALERKIGKRALKARFAQNESRLRGYLEGHLADTSRMFWRQTKKVAGDPKATVVISTFNAGANLDKLLKNVTEQEAPWAFDVLVIDKGSSDDTLQIVSRYPTVEHRSVSNDEYSQGQLNNFAVAESKGTFIAFLDQDALPTNESWLFNLVSTLEEHPDAAGVFGRQIPNTQALPFTKRDVAAHFDLMGSQPPFMNKLTNKKRYNQQDDDWLHFLRSFSNQNCCIRRSVWAEIPFRAIDFGHDQLWASDIIEAGHGKLYSTRASVYFSKEMSVKEVRDYNVKDAAFQRHFFGYKRIATQRDLRIHLDNADHHDKSWAKEQKLSDGEIKARCAQNEARLRGYLDGYLADTSAMF